MEGLFGDFLQLYLFVAGGIEWGCGSSRGFRGLGKMGGNEVGGEVWMAVDDDTNGIKQLKSFD